MIPSSALGFDVMTCVHERIVCCCMTLDTHRVMHATDICSSPHLAVRPDRSPSCTCNDMFAGPASMAGASTHRAAQLPPRQPPPSRTPSPVHAQQQQQQQQRHRHLSGHSSPHQQSASRAAEPVLSGALHSCVPIRAVIVLPAVEDSWLRQCRSLVWILRETCALRLCALNLTLCHWLQSSSALGHRSPYMSCNCASRIDERLGCCHVAVCPTHAHPLLQMGCRHRPAPSAAPPRCLRPCRCRSTCWVPRRRRYWRSTPPSRPQGSTRSGRCALFTYLNRMHRDMHGLL